MKKWVFTLSTLSLLLTMNGAEAHNDRQATNKKNVIQFYNKAINEKNFGAASQYLGPHYIQHNPLVTDGLLGLKTFIDYLRTNYPKAHSNIKRIFAEDDYVICQVHSIREPGTPGRAIFDLFKLKNGKIIEHWDVIQDIPQKSFNSNGMF